MSSTDIPRASWSADAGQWGRDTSSAYAAPRDGLGSNLSGILSNILALLRRAEHWLDARGRGAWIATMILAFVFVWPVGLALLAYLIWSKRMFAKTCRNRSNAAFSMGRTSGNSAFDAYREDTLRRLEEEQRAFESFLGRLRAAKDKAEFDQFMDERSRRGSQPATEQAEA